MTLEISDYANDAPPPAKIADLTSYVFVTDRPNAIDAFRLTIQETLRYGTFERLSENHFLGRLLVLRVVSAAEAYFRKALADGILICPTARAHCTEKTINLGGLLWHGRARYAMSAFDNTSFSSSKEVRNAAKGYLNFEMSDQIFLTLNAEYDKACQLRHSIIHADGLVPGKNAAELRIPPNSDQLEIRISEAELQEVAAVVTTYINTFNRGLFALMCNRWAIQWRRLPNWSGELESRSFGDIWRTFVSQEELKVRPGRSKITRSACMSAVRAQYGL